MPKFLVCASDFLVHLPEFIKIQQFNLSSLGPSQPYLCTQTLTLSVLFPKHFEVNNEKPVQLGKATTDRNRCGKPGQCCWFKSFPK